ncbi:ATP synthase mitochondrial F1 complex assembly factor 1 [Episyrphus balteatus]|uniref:ATP synthase mitochondrial F1 complex assembly factor 1 n=1 Tax=Episyrphus balteatus TaxID=286459 RepID=UPI002485024B|nr:ATP synthase mitochondrial F1 complex assembly factor 1 [Episyrphus balteatus]
MACTRRLLPSLVINSLTKRSFMMSSKLRAEEVLDDIKTKNPYFEKYAAKIAALQKTSPDEFVERMEKVVTIKEAKKKKENRDYSELLNPKKPVKEVTGEIPHKKLSDIMKLELVEDKSADELKQIWYEYHKTKDVIAATLTIEQFDTLMTRAKQHPIFILPLPRSEGFEIFLLQFSANTVHFTPLLAYQIHNENAPECLNIVHYTEVKDKGVILMRGEYDSKVLTGQEAQCLANELQMFYCMNDPAKLKVLETFTKQPDSFKHMDLIKQVEEIQLK